MDPKTAGGTPAREPVGITRVPDVGLLTALFVGPIQGLLTHWTARGSIACPGPDACPAGTHRGRSTWYGFAPVRLWSHATKRWHAEVLQVTEALEEILRDFDLRGMVWEMGRVEQKRKARKVTAAFLERRHDAALLTSWDIRPAVERMYHTREIMWCVPNPIPPRVCVEAVEAAPPPSLAAKPRPEPMPITDEQRRQLRELAGRRTGPTPPPRPPADAQPSSNGRNHS